MAPIYVSVYSVIYIYIYVYVELIQRVARVYKQFVDTADAGQHSQRGPKYPLAYIWTPKVYA